VGSVERAVATAKVIAGDAAMKNARACIQVHGGMGYTWEVPAHYYLKRVWVLENAFGDVSEHAEHMAEIIAAD
jgi:alkylation response protein AidB-like acyl-CoA dehydrogenase